MRVPRNVLGHFLNCIQVIRGASNAATVGMDFCTAAANKGADVFVAAGKRVLIKIEPCHATGMPQVWAGRCRKYCTSGCLLGGMLVRGALSNARAAL
ncbi:hypothetical protein [Nocardia sp. NPDC004604]|uniref:hypothetical protein n=1 Tax=Nocardia sp. NPDC004604 TaxID=3157013 RepID=UPI0033BEF42E